MAARHDPRQAAAEAARKKKTQTQAMTAGCAVVLVVFGIILAFTIADCGTSPTAQQSQKASAIAAVKATFRESFAVGSWATGPLMDGTAVLRNDDTAYWVSSTGVVYAANGWAKTMSPSVDYAPVGIDIRTVRMAVRGDKRGEEEARQNAAPYEGKWAVLRAWRAAMEVVEERLSLPESASFSFDSSDWVTDMGQGVYVVKGSVDVPKATGAKLRIDFVLKVRQRSRELWVLVEEPLFTER